MSSDEKLLQAVTTDRAIFERMLRDIACSPKCEKPLRAKKAICFACKSSTSYLSSHIIENVFLELAKEIHVPKLDGTFDENTALHVMTECYNIGGHTRVVERWIELSEGERHSLIFTSNPRQTVPPKLSSVVEASGGNVIRLKDSLSEIQKASELSRIASRFQRIILHVHMHDVVPLIAFGTNKFERPIILYNHADHLFWLGVSIADVVLETRNWGKMRSVCQRGVKKSVVVGIPNDISINPEIQSRDQVLESMGIDPSKKIILTAGSPHKYIKFGSWDFISAMHPVLEMNTKAVLIFVGPRPRDLQDWSRLEKRFGPRVFALGPKSPSELHSLMMASDLYLDSFPVSGGTALSDAVMAGVPCLSMKSVTGHLDFTLKKKAYCKSADELQEKSSELLQDPHLAKVYEKELKQALLKSSGKTVWKEQIKAIYDQLPLKHTVNDFEETSGSNGDELALYTALFHRRKKYFFHVPRAFSIYHANHNGKRRFGIDFDFV